MFQIKIMSKINIAKRFFTFIQCIQFLEVDLPVMEKTRYGTSYGPWYSVPSYGNKITKIKTKTTYHIPSTTITKYGGGFNQGTFYGDLGRK